MSQKEAQTTRTLFMVCLCFVVFVMPMETYDILFYLDLLPHGGNSYVYLPLHLLYWFQYSANFFIYAARSDQFRKAYLFFFSSVRMKSTYHFSIKMSIFLLSLTDLELPKKTELIMMK